MTFDIRTDEDLSLAIMNLISLEEHAFFTAKKTGEDRYLDMLGAFRRMRTDLLKRIVTDPQGEEWCMSKHLLATTMRLIETANKFREQDEKLASQLYDHAFDTYSLFWHINDKKAPSKKRFSQTTKRVAEQTGQPEPASRMQGVLAKARKMVKEAIDCCKEL